MSRDETLYRYMHSVKTHLSSPALKGLSDIIMVALTAGVSFLILPTVLLVVNVHKP